MRWKVFSIDLERDSLCRSRLDFFDSSVGDFERFGRFVDAPFMVADKDDDEATRAVLKVAERTLLALEGFVSDFVNWVFIF